MKEESHSAESADLSRILELAEQSVRQYFSARNEDPARGTLEISGERYILVRAESLSRRFFGLVTHLYSDWGEEKARQVASGFLFDLAHALGKADARAFHVKMGIEDPLQKFTIGPCHFAFTGWASVELLPGSTPTPDHDYMIHYYHHHSFEAEAWMHEGEATPFPVCVMNAGYSSGWCEESFGIPLVAMELHCRAMGHEHCHFIMAPPERIESQMAKLFPDLHSRSEGPRAFEIPEFFRRKRIEEELNRAVEIRTDELEKANTLLKRELSERKKIQEALWTSEEKYHTLFEDSRDAIYINTRDGCFVDVNRSALELFGYNRDELLGMSAGELYADLEDRQRFQEQIEKHGSVRDFEVGLRRKDGRLIHCLVTSSVRRDTQGEITGYQGIIHDITERKQAEHEQEQMQAQLLQAQKLEAVGTLAGGVAHDFNNLLTAIRGYTDLGLLKAGENDPLRWYFKQINQASLRAAELTRQLLLFSRKQPMEMVPIDLNDAVGELLQMLGRLIGEDITVSTHQADHLWTIRADSGSIGQVIMNLAVNARDAMPEGGEISISTENLSIDDRYCRRFPDARPGKYVCLRISDTGTGVAPEVVDHIFEPFFSTKESGKGTGLGLAVVFGIVKQHEGWITVESEPGKGTSFSVFIPVFDARPQAEKRVESATGDFQGKGERILLVEDEADVRELVSEALTGNGYDVISTTSAGEALEVFQREEGRFDLVFSDVVLADQTGLQLVEELLNQNPDLRILLSSGYAGQKSQWTAIRDRGYRFLKKPYALTSLFQALQNAIHDEVT